MEGCDTEQAVFQIKFPRRKKYYNNKSKSKLVVK